MWPGIVMLIGGLVNSLLQSRNDRKNTQRTIAGQKELSQYAFSQNQIMAQEAYNRDVSMWERQNAYNDPAAQMARLKGAGLNPNLIYGSGSAVGNQSGPPPSFSPAQYNAPDIQYRYSPMQIPQMLGQYQDFQMKSAQVDNVRAQTQATRMNTIASIFGLERGRFDLERARALAPYQLEVQANEAEASKYTPAFRQGVDQNQFLRNLILMEEYKSQPTKAAQLEADLMFSRYRNDWMRAGVTSSDNPLLRILTRMWSESGMSVSNVRRKIFGN